MPNQETAVISIDTEKKFKWYTPKDKVMKFSDGASNNSFTEDVGHMSSSEDYLFLQDAAAEGAIISEENGDDEMSSSDDYLFSMIGAEEEKEDVKQ